QHFYSRTYSASGNEIYCSGGFSAASITSMSTVAVVSCNSSPSCSRRAAIKAGRSNTVAGPLVNGSGGDIAKSISKSQVTPLISTTRRHITATSPFEKVVIEVFVARILEGLIRLRRSAANDDLSFEPSAATVNV